VEDRDFKAMTKGRGSLGRNVLIVAPAMGAVIFAVAYAVSRSVIVAAAVGGGLCAASVISNVLFFREVRRRESRKNDSHSVEVTEVEATRVVDVEHLGSHGPAFCFFVGDDKALLLIGQWLNEYRSFPANSFLLHRWADTRQRIRIESKGRRVTPELSRVRLRPGYRNGDIELFTAAPDTLQEDLDSAFGGPHR
jgi:uncharacterized membrane protein